MIDVNVGAALRLTQAVVPYLRDRALADHHDPVMTNNLPGGKPGSAATPRTARLRRSK
jgi:hypothetical protein